MRVLCIAALVTLSFLLPLGALLSYLRLPDVYMSHSEQKCVRVIHSDGSPGSCESLPKRYHVIWVE